MAATDTEAALTNEQAISRLEQAAASKLNLDLSEFDPQDVLKARRERIEVAAAKAKDLVDEAFAEPDLTDEQRIARLEAAYRSGGLLP